jgi:hypothetical protein
LEKLQPGESYPYDVPWWFHVVFFAAVFAGPVFLLHNGYDFYRSQRLHQEWVHEQTLRCFKLGGRLESSSFQALCWWSAAGYKQQLIFTETRSLEE